MKILLVHNYYQQPGGEESCFADEVALLQNHGHEVLTYVRHNNELKSISALSAARKTIWNQETYHDLKALLRKSRPDVAHFHNTFPLISPSAYYAMQEQNIPVVQTLHNFRLLCPGSLFFRHGRPCEKCSSKIFAWPGILHACYRQDRAATAVVAAMLAVHRLLKTWPHKVDRFIAVSNFVRQKFIEAGFPAERIVVKPNFLAASLDATPVETNDESGGRESALFVGRLSCEKGVGTMLETWRRGNIKIPLRIVGDGPLAPVVRTAAAENATITWLGQQPAAEVHALMRRAALLIFPSECYETFGRVAMEAFAAGTPVIAAGSGAIAEIVSHGTTGLHFEPGNASDLAAKVQWALEHPEEIKRMGMAARKVYEDRYTAGKNHQMLMQIYQQAAESQRMRQSEVQIEL